MHVLCRFAFLIAVLAAVSLPGQAQVYPGDVNADGRVNQYDLPYLGYAFGAFGPARPDDGSVFGPQDLLLDWDQNFPDDGPNFAHADCNGDGQVGLVDFLLLYANFGQTTATPDSFFLPQGIPGQDPRLGFDAPDIIYAAPGQTLSIPIFLGDAGDSVAFNGLAFAMDYPTDEIELSIDFTNSWIVDSSTLSLVHTDDPDGILSVALTRFGSDELLGNGPVAVVNFIVEGDLIGLLQSPDDSLKLEVELSEIMLVDGDFEFSGVLPDTVHIVVKHPDALLSVPEPPAAEAIRVFPNPAGAAVWVDAPQPVQRAEWISLTGQVVRQWKPDAGPGLLRLPRPGRGLYVLRLWTGEGRPSMHKIIFY